jgi:hypothetical protein
MVTKSHDCLIALVLIRAITTLANSVAVTVPVGRVMVRECRETHRGRLPLCQRDSSSFALLVHALVRTRKNAPDLAGRGRVVC